MNNIVLDYKFIDFIFIKNINLNGKIENFLNSNLKLHSLNIQNYQKSYYIYFINYEYKKLQNIYNFLKFENSNIIMYLIRFEKLIDKYGIEITEVYNNRDIISFKKTKFKLLIDFFSSKTIHKNLLFKELNKKSCSNKLLISINNFKNLGLDIKSIFNIFSVFGNINKIYYDFLYGIIYLYFDCFEAINNIINNKLYFNVLNNLFIIKLLKYKNIKYKNFVKSIEFENEELPSQVIYNIPTNKLIVSNISILLTNFKFYKLISGLNHPMLIKFIDCKNTKSCFIEFETVKESISFIINMNTKLFEKYQFNIKFISSLWI